MKIGLILPFIETHMGGSTARWRDLGAICAAAEDVGFDSVWVPDHLLVQDPGLPVQGAWECWTMLAGSRQKRIGSHSERW